MKDTTEIVVTNHFPQPSFELGSLPNWSGGTGITRTIDSNKSRSGGSSMKLVSDGTSNAGPLLSGVSLPLNTTFTFSAYVWIPSGQPTAGSSGVSLRVGGTGVPEPKQSAATDIRNQWVRLSHTFTINSGTATFYLYTANSNNAITWWDDLQIVEGSQPLDYFSGNTESNDSNVYAWTGTPNNSASTHTFSPLKELLRTKHAVEATPNLIVEWNQNTHVASTASNVPNEEDEGYDVELYPIESIIESRRPTRGIVKAKTGQAKVTEDFQEKPYAARYFTVDDKDKYKYWAAPKACAPSGVIVPEHTDGLTSAKPRVIYNKNVDINKIVIGFETSYASPAIWEVLLQYTDGGSWDTVASSPNIKPNGQTVLYFDGSNWGTPVNRASTVSIRGIQIRITTMDTMGSRPEVIEISGRLEKDLSRFLISASDTMSMSSKSFIAPLGLASENTAEVTLFNDLVDENDPELGLLLNNDNTNSLYHGMIDANVKFTLGYEYDTTEFGGEEDEYVQAFSMWSNVWNNQTSGEVVVSLQDSSKFLQEENPHKVMYEDVSIGGVIWRLCDMIGFSNYNVESRDDDPATIISIWHTDGESTIWEEMQEIAESTQTAIYFDAYDVLQVKTRKTAYNETKKDWGLRSDISGSRLPDIIETSQTETYEANHITINYEMTDWTNWRRGVPKMETVWAPEETIVLRAENILRTIDAADVLIWINNRAARIWPWDGIVNVEGELIRYDGKQYRYYDENGNKQTKIINSEAELRKTRAKTSAAKKHLNGFTGGLLIKQRGLWNTEQKKHSVEVTGYSKNIIRPPGGKKGSAGFQHEKKDSTVSIRTKPQYEAKSIYMMTQGQATDEGFWYYGTRMWLEKGSFKHNRAGLVFHVSGLMGAGYYVDIQPSKYLDGKNRKDRHEIIFYSQDSDGNAKRFGGQQIKTKNASKGVATPEEKKGQSKGMPFNVDAGKPIDLDISVQDDGSNGHTIQIFINGNLLMTPNVPNGQWKQDKNGKFGMYARGHTKVYYEYLYAIGRNEGHYPDSISFFDRVRGGYISDQWMREWVFRLRKESRRPKLPAKKEKEKYNAIYMDEFGPIAHEVREFDVKFEPAPVLHSKLYVSNDWSAACPEYKADSYGAEFLLANTSRKNAVVNGSDSLSFSGQGDVDQVIFVFGRALKSKDTKTVKIKDEGAIRKRGKVESEITSKWIQSKDEAERLGEWIKSHWSGGNDEVQATIFGNPLIEIGDVVTLDYPERDYEADTHKYFVVGTNTDWQSGLQTILTLRRCKL